VAKQFHAYYMIMLAPPIAVLCGAAFGWVFERVEKLALWQRLAFTAACALTIAFQVYLAMQYIPFAAWMLIPAGVCLAAGILLLEPAFLLKWKQAIAVLLLLSTLVMPAWWSVQTVLISGSGQSLPAAYAGETRDFGNFRMSEAENESGLLDYLQAITQGVKYLVAVDSSTTGAPYVLATGRPVLYMGGFGGGDDVVDAEGLAALVQKGELRYVLEGGGMGGGGMSGSRSDIAAWLEQSCTLVDPSEYGGAGGGGFRQGGAGTLYRCGN
jgi:4-amino-4-deoxy-L-arabinose transferase-like glycosyltransferase